MYRRIWYYFINLILFIGLLQIPRLFWNNSIDSRGWLISRVIFFGGAIIYIILSMWVLKDKLIKIWISIDNRIYFLLNIVILLAFLFELLLSFRLKL